MPIPTKDELKKVLEATKKVRQKLPEISFFGDNNWEVLDEQIEILANEIEDKNFISSLDQDISDAQYDCVYWVEEGDENSDFGTAMLEDAE